MIYLMAIEDAEILEQETENFVKLGGVFSVSMFKKPEKKLKNYVFIFYRIPNELESKVLLFAKVVTQSGTVLVGALCDT